MLPSMIDSAFFSLSLIEEHIDFKSSTVFCFPLVSVLGYERTPSLSLLLPSFQFLK